MTLLLALGVYGRRRRVFARKLADRILADRSLANRRRRRRRLLARQIGGGGSAKHGHQSNSAQHGDEAGRAQQSKERSRHPYFDLHHRNPLSLSRPSNDRPRDALFAPSGRAIPPLHIFDPSQSTTSRATTFLMNG